MVYAGVKTVADSEQKKYRQAIWIVEGLHAVWREE
jgi:hypothetical protein